LAAPLSWCFPKKRHWPRQCPIHSVDCVGSHSHNERGGQRRWTKRKPRIYSRHWAGSITSPLLSTKIYASSAISRSKSIAFFHWSRVSRWCRKSSSATCNEAVWQSVTVTVLSRLGLVSRHSEKSACECEVSITRRGRYRLKRARACLSERCGKLAGELTESDLDLLERAEDNLRRFASPGSRPS